MLCDYSGWEYSDFRGIMKTVTVIYKSLQFLKLILITAVTDRFTLILYKNYIIYFSKQQQGSKRKLQDYF